MTTLSASIAGIGFWTDGLPSWEAARAFAATARASTLSFAGVAVPCRLR